MAELKLHELYGSWVECAEIPSSYLRDLHLHSKQHSGYPETVSSFYESEALQHNIGVGNCYLESGSPSLHPKHTFTYRGSYSHTGTIIVMGPQFRFQSHQAKLVHTYFRPHTQNIIPGWCVDNNLGSESKGSLVGAQEPGLGRPGFVLQLPHLPCGFGIGYFLSLSFPAYIMGMIIIPHRIAAKVK